MTFIIKLKDGTEFEIEEPQAGKTLKVISVKQKALLSGEMDVLYKALAKGLIENIPEDYKTQKQLFKTHKEAI